MKLAQISVAICVVFLIQGGHAAPGDLDPAFGQRGTVATHMGYAFGTAEDAAMAKDVVVQNDGKTLVAGSARGSSPALARYNVDGSLDRTFGYGTYGLGELGTFVFPMSGSLESVVVRPDGKILAAGHMQGPTNDMVLSLMLFTEQGLLDETFASGGIAQTQIGDSQSFCHDMAIQSDGKIVLVGYAYNGSNGGYVLVRYDESGMIDASFGVAGKVTTPVSGGSDKSPSVVIQSDGKIVVAGYSYNGGFAVVRHNADGSLDSSFGIGGQVTTSIGPGTHIALSLMLQSDGKIVVAGRTWDGSSYQGVIVRYDSGGNLDSSFGVAGVVTTAALTDAVAAVQSDGRIVAVGRATNETSSFDEFAVARFAADGSIDSSFGTGGNLRVPVGSRNAQGLGVTLQVDGKIVVAGYAEIGLSKCFAVVRHHADGTLDGAFGGGKTFARFGYTGQVPSDVGLQTSGHIVVTGGLGNALSSIGVPFVSRFSEHGEPDLSFGQGGGTYTFWGDSGSVGRMALQNDGKVVSPRSSGSSGFSLLRYQPDGSLDASFGSTGVVTTPYVLGVGLGRGAVVQADGKIVTVCSLYNGSNQDFAAVRHHADGSLDVSFGTGGKVSTPIGPGDDWGRDLAIQSDGKIVLGGYCSNGSNNDFALVRYDTDGNLDSSFGTAGKVTTGIGTGHDEAYAMKIQSDGKIVMAGMSSNGANTDFALVRYRANGTLDPEFGSAGKVVTPIGTSSDEAVSLALQRDGRIVVTGFSITAVGRDIALLRYNSDGSLDSGFGSGGKVLTDVAGGTDFGRGVVVQNDGNIVVVGRRHGNGGVGAVALMRYFAGPLLSAVSTNLPTGTSETQITLNGAVNPNGSATTGQFEFGLTSVYGSAITVPIAVADGTTPQNVSAALTGLTPGTVYHYRLTATNAGGVISTRDATFTTLLSHAGWRELHFGIGTNDGNAADTFDFDNDGLPNLIEWACGLNPTASSTLPASIASTSGGLEFVYTRSLSAVAAGTVFDVEWSDTLLGMSWSTTGVTQTILSDNGVTQQVKATLSAGSGSPRFVRLRVTPTP